MRTPQASTLSSWGLALSAGILLLAAGTAHAGPPATVKLQGSHNLGDLGPDWTASLSIEGTERLQFYWQITPARVQRQVEYQLLEKSGGTLLAKKALGTLAAGGKQGWFQLDFKPIPVHPAYRVLVKVSQGQTAATSNDVVVTRVKPGPGTVFTDKGLQLPLTPMLESLRKKHNVPALGGAIVTDKGIDAIGVVGIRQHGQPTLATEHDLWHLGSNTKAMTATLVALLVDQGKLRWNMTLAECFPERALQMHAHYRTVTVDRLLAQVAGIPNSHTQAENAALANASRTLIQRRCDFMLLVIGRAPQTPGKHVYSNANFIIAGAMIERVTGQPWETVITQKLFHPLGMTSFGFGAPGSSSTLNQPRGHQDTAQGRKSFHADNTPGLGPAGTVHASMRDWAKFIRLHLTGKQGSVTLSKASFDHLHTGAYGQSYVGGWVVFTKSWTAGNALWHNGSNTMWYSACKVFPGKKFAVLGVCNIGPWTWGPGDKAVEELLDLLIKRQMEW